MSQTFSRCTGWIVNRPVISISLLAAITSLAITGYKSPLLFDRLFAQEVLEDEEDDFASDSFVPDVDAISLGGADAVLIAECDSFFTPAGSEAMRYVVESLESLPHVSNVMWLDQIPIINIFGLPEPLLPNQSAPLSRFEAARDKAKNHPLVTGQFLSEDGRTMLLLIEFDFLMVRDDRDCDELLQTTATIAAAEFEDVEIGFSVTGRVPFFLTAMDSHEQNRLKYQIIAYAMIVIMSVILFRGFTAVFIVAIAPALGVFWTLGIIRFFEFQDNPFNDVVLPILISLVGFTDGVHLIVQIRRNRAGGMSAFEAAKLGIRQVGLACALTSLTTAIGFGSLSLAHHQFVREFGWSCVIGVTLTFVAVITVIPLACASWLGNRVHIGHDRGLIDTNLNRISGVIDAVLKRAKVLSVIGIVTTIGLILVSVFLLKPDERQANVLPLNSPASRAIAKMDEALGGLEYAYINITWSENVEADSSEILDVIRKIDDSLAAEELIGYPISIRNLLDALPGDGNDEDRMSMLELLPPPLKRAFYVPEERKADVTFRVRDLGIARYGPVFERLESTLEELRDSHREFGFEMSGAPIWRWENLYQIVVDLAASLGAASFVIFVVLSIAYRSLRIGLISIIPNMFPLAVAGAYLVLTGQNLEVVTVCAFTCCLGIAVDDTIHFLTRYREELQQETDEGKAIQKAFTGVGTALIMTTIVLVAGFLTVQWSDTREHRIFASMGAITVSMALFGDLIFLPAILARFNKQNVSTTDSEQSNQD